MPSSTAAWGSEITINPLGIVYASDPELVSRFIRRFGQAKANATVIWPAAGLNEIPPIPASWLDTVQKRITDSIVTPDTTQGSEGSYLEPTIAHAANSVFERTSDILPGEPFIYSSRGGDLVAEFTAPHGKLTTIISQSYLIAFASIKDVAMERHIDLECTNSSFLRAELKQLSTALSTGRVNGAKVES